MPLVILFPKSLEPVRQLRAPFSLVRELGDEQCKWLSITRDPQGARVHRIETHVADQFSGYPFAARIIPAVHEAGFACSAASLEDAEKHFARHGVERADDPSPRNLLCKGLRTGRRVADDESVLSAFIGSEQLTITLPDRSPA